MFTAHDSPHNGPVKSPRALLRASIENALGIRQKPVAVAQPRRKPTKPALPWDNEPDQEIRQYAQRYHERNPRQSVEEAYQYAKAQIRANRAFPSRND